MEIKDLIPIFIPEPCVLLYLLKIPTMAREKLTRLIDLFTETYLSPQIFICPWKKYYI
jgi:hypothetical protein